MISVGWQPSPHPVGMPRLLQSCADRRRSRSLGRAAARHTDGMVSKWSIASEDSLLSIASYGSTLSIGSVGSVASVGSIGSALSACSVASALGAGAAMSFRAVGSVMSTGDSGRVMGGARPGSAVRWAAAQGLLIATVAAAAVLGHRRASR